ncbi:amino acid adenylation domain-containing protein [Nonomuraea sp. NPDC046802]|uniref:amino acid adenylation domain-containing protein n=1 Tax=Nonomuraea sp. NPDC046802 TaxID=3154919 RepID=UPI0033E4DD5C
MDRDGSARKLIDELAAAGVQLWEEDGRLRFRAPSGVMTEERKAALTARREAVLEELRGPVAVAHPEQRHDPFPVTDVQAAYLIGRRETFAYGGVGCHGYGEIELPELDVKRLEAAWRRLIARHDMLRAVIEQEGAQRVLPEVPEYRIDVDDVDETGFDKAVAYTRAELSHHVYRPDVWPLFTLRVTRAPGKALLHFSIDFLICDFVSIRILLDELHTAYHHPDREPPPLEITFRDYLQAEGEARSGPLAERDRGYWLDRLDELPPAPELPLNADAESAPPRFARHELKLAEEEWAALRRRAGANGVTPSVAVLAAYAEVIGRWSGRPRFTLDITLLNRMPLHPQVNDLVGDFTSVNLLAVEPETTLAFHARAKNLQAALWTDLDHRLCSGVQVVRELARRRGSAAAIMPVVFTSAIGLDEGKAREGFAHPGYGISQTPQVWIDCQNIEHGGTLVTNWDVREGVFPDGVVEDMFAAYERLLRRLATADDAWDEVSPVPLPEAQRARRERVNDTVAPVPAGLLHEGLLARALHSPDEVAVIAADRTLTYRELVTRADGVAQELARCGCTPGDLVAVVAGKGWRQIVAVLGTLMAGAAYVPVDVDQPPARRDQILTSAGCRLVLTEAALAGQEWPQTCRAVAVDDLAGTLPGVLPPSPTSQDALAYVIHTSGSTGTPKGVMVSHRAALNTVADINQRFEVGQNDRVLGLASLGFDLSVYDIFGPPAAGAALVLPAQDRRGDPVHWAELVADHGITLWNSVPAQLQMLADYLRAAPEVDLPTLRLALLSGDWIPVPLPDQIRGGLPGLRVISLGGATEAAIWSIYHPIGQVDPAWRSIPYGVPLANQTFHVMDAALRPNPDWVTGELYIGGIGLAEGYLHDGERTAERFITEPATGGRLYRTGDLGRYLPDGTIEFLGRQDFQVKIRGHRIELAEIETALGAHPGVAGCAVIAHGDQPTQRRLAAFAEQARRERPPLPDRNELADRATRAGAELLEGLNVPAYLAFLRKLDEAGLLVMLDAFRHSGLFTGPGDTHTLDEINARLGVAPRHRRLVRRFLRALTAEGVLGLSTGGRYQLRRTVDQHEQAKAWRPVTALAAAAGQDDAELLGYFRTSAQRLPDLLRDVEDPAKLLFPEGRFDVSDRLYSGTLFNRWAGRMAAATVRGLLEGHRGTARVLEVGAGAGGTTAEVLDRLDGIPVDYLCTDLSPFFLDEARRRFGHRTDVGYAPLDLDVDLRSQGLAPNSVDLVVAGDVLHATRDIGATLANLTQVLKPGGWIVFVEMTRDHYQIMASLELLVRLDQSLGDFADLRRGTDATFLDAEQWTAMLEQAGAEPALCLPGQAEAMAEVGIRTFAARVKAGRTPLDPAELREHLAARLPDYMIPPAIQVVDALPYNSSGKLDRSALNRWVDRGGSAPAVAGEAPRTALERRLAAIWGEVLGVEHVARDHDFFALGGDSLQAARLGARIIEEIPEAAEVFFDELLRNVLENPQVAALAAYLTGQDSALPAEPDALDEQPEGEPVLVPLGGTGERRYLLAHDATGSFVGHPRLLRALRERGTVFGVSGELLARHRDLPAHLLRDRLVADVVAEVPRQGSYRVVGYGSGGALALHLARQLAESGVELTGLTLTDPLADDGPADPCATDITVIRTPGGPDMAGWWEHVCLGRFQVLETEDASAAALGRALDGEGG